MASRSQQSNAKATPRSDDPHVLAVVAADLEAIGAPTTVALVYCNPTFVPPLNTANVAIGEAVDLHHAVDPFVIGRIAISGQSLALEDGVDPPMGAGDPDHLCHGLHWEPTFGSDGGSRNCFLSPWRARALP